jgi:hypothetical protein
VAVGDNIGRQEVNEGHKSSWGATLENVMPHRHAVDSVAPTASPPELYAVLVSGPGVEVRGKPIASFGPAYKADVSRSEFIAAAPLSSNFGNTAGGSWDSAGDLGFFANASRRPTPENGNSKLGYEIAPSDNQLSRSESGSVVERSRKEDGRNQNRTIKVAADQQRDDGRIAIGSSVPRA